jgi:hypothetical protein
MPRLSGKKRKAQEDNADDEVNQNDDSSGAPKSVETGKTDQKNADKDVDSPFDDSTIVIEGDDIPSDLHESGRHTPDHRANDCTLWHSDHI